MTRKIFLMSLLILLVSGCSPASAASTPTPDQPALAGGWTSITMHQSGGIMGLSRSIKVSPDGSFSVTDERAKVTVNYVLSKAELSDLNQKIAGLNIPSNPPNGAVCADCFIYNLIIQKDAGEIRALLSDVTLPGSGFESLVAFLRGLGDRLLK
jgi:hypothetical protein